MNQLEQDGYCVFEADPRVSAWAKAAAPVARELVQSEALRTQWLRHQETWFVGVDTLPNAPDGSISGACLAGPWDTVIEAPKTWHKAQVSAVYPGYPKQDDTESDANHRFRTRRCAAHVDGILLENGRRFLREPHSFILGLPLGNSSASPLVVWPKSHILMRDALREMIAQSDPKSVDLTAGYKTARAKVFEQIEPVEVHAKMGQSMLLHRHLLHGVAPWKDGDSVPPEGRIVAYFRPQFERMQDWLSAP